MDAKQYSNALREEELKNKVAADWFGAFDCTRIIGNIDFCVDIPATELALGYEAEPALWAEAKAGSKRDIVASFVQLILTIGGQHIADKNLPPHFLGAFDAEKIAFLPYNAVLDVLGKNDFDWTVAPSDHESKEFKELYALAKGVIEREKLLFRFAEDEAELRRFIKSNFKSGRRDVTKILINKNNFTHIYRQWREAVMPHINANWDVLKRKYAVYDRDFYLAEMNIVDNGTADIADPEPLHRPPQERGRARRRALLRLQARRARRLRRVLAPIQAPAAQGILELHREPPRPARAAGRARAEGLVLHSEEVGGALPALPRARAWA